MDADARRCWHRHFARLLAGYVADLACARAHARVAPDRRRRRFWLQEALRMRAAARSLRAHLGTIADWA